MISQTFFLPKRSATRDKIICRNIVWHLLFVSSYLAQLFQCNSFLGRQRFIHVPRAARKLDVAIQYSLIFDHRLIPKGVVQSAAAHQGLTKLKYRQQIHRIPLIIDDAVECHLIIRIFCKVE